MKLSVSVPDELWDRARTAVTEDSPSAVIQAALRRLVDEGPARPAYSQAPVLDSELAQQRAATSARLQAEVRELYQLGYRNGIELASKLNWSKLSWIAKTGGIAASKSTVEMVHEFQNGNRAGLTKDDKPLIDPDLLVDYFGSYADMCGGGWTPADVTVEGTDRALRDVRAQVMASGPEVTADQSDHPSTE
jgi:hypothetical protein